MFSLAIKSHSVWAWSHHTWNAKCCSVSFPRFLIFTLKILKVKKVKKTKLEKDRKNLCKDTIKAF